VRALAGAVGSTKMVRMKTRAKNSTRALSCEAPPL